MVEQKITGLFQDRQTKPPKLWDKNCTGSRDEYSNMYMYPLYMADAA